ncbi:hypothetical protein [Suttonella ornithocola]|uniref:Uncharacterized protein n=1 Tax=Suttonella ornithocola TaxID=279832 RepID=A0A380MX56_9GAMM|nr:hypothetical protein [Suttonella ornithocola]SUO96868.1 Uncharacterised protein [Suttonella ornithocola]
MSYEDKARQILQKIIDENKQNDYAGIDRTPKGVENRRQRMQIASDPHSKFGGKAQGFGAELEQHIINGDLSSDQSVEVLMALYGLN